MTNNDYSNRIKARLSNKTQDIPGEQMVKPIDNGYKWQSDGEYVIQRLKTDTRI